jgi:hypothetical protein
MDLAPDGSAFAQLTRNHPSTRTTSDDSKNTQQFARINLSVSPQVDLEKQVMSREIVRFDAWDKVNRWST